MISDRVFLIIINQIEFFLPLSAAMRERKMAKMGSVHLALDRVLLIHIRCEITSEMSKKATKTTTKAIVAYSK